MVAVAQCLVILLGAALVTEGVLRSRWHAPNVLDLLSGPHRLLRVASHLHLPFTCCHVLYLYFLLAGRVEAPWFGARGQRVLLGGRLVVIV